MLPSSQRAPTLVCSGTSAPSGASRRTWLGSPSSPVEKGPPELTGKAAIGEEYGFSTLKVRRPRVAVPAKGRGASKMKLWLSLWSTEPSGLGARMVKR